MSKTNFLRFTFLVLTLVFTCSHLQAATPAQDDKKKAKKEAFTADGPYILYNEDQTCDIITVSSKGEIEKQQHTAVPEILNIVSHDRKHHFQVKLHPVNRPEWQYSQPEKVFVMSDPHGDLDCVINLLRRNGVIGKKYQWTFGQNHLVIIGDVFDRGNDVLQIFWLIYKLEEEARKAGGTVSFLLGNHEPLVLMNDQRYTKAKYKQLADTLHVSYPALFGRNTELGHWLCTRNTMMTIGRNLFVHAGLSGPFLERDLSIPTVNEEMSRGLYLRKAERKALSPLTEFLFGSFGPVWYRGLVKEKAKYHPLPADSLSLILQKYESDRLFVGHTIFEDISTFYDKRVVAVNVDNRKNRKAKRGRAVLIEGDRIIVVGDKGRMRTLVP